MMFNTIIFFSFGIGFLLINELGTLLVCLTCMLIVEFVYIRDNKLLLKYGLIALIFVVLILFFMWFYYHTKCNAGNFSVDSKLDAIIWKLISRWQAHKLNGKGAFQIQRGIEAIKRGGLLGSRSKVYIPNYDNDMVFSFLIMRFGALVSLMVVVSYYLIFYFGQKIYKSNNCFNSLINYYFSLSFFVQAMIIILGSTNYIVLTGIVLPFISDGGTALVIHMVIAVYLVDASVQEQSVRRISKKTERVIHKIKGEC